MSATLSTATLPAISDGVALPAFDRAATGIGIVHIGPGAFHRGHQAVFTDDAMARSGGNWAICGLSLNSRGTAEDLTAQDGLYTLAIKDKTPSYRIIGSIKEALCAKDDPSAALERLCAPQTKIVTLTITEKGYALTSDGALDLNNPRIKADLKSPNAPSSAIGYLVLACQIRRDLKRAPLTLISCDNLPDNGHKLRAACLDYAKAIDASLAEYMSDRVRFPNTMVDSITPATDEGVIADVEAATGLHDAAPIQREQFTQWVIEDNLPDDRPDWAGAGAIITPDVGAYENLKLRVLNGAHSTLTYLGLLSGLNTVEDAINDASLRGFVDSLMQDEVLPILEPVAGLNPQDYWQQIIARFENPHIRHRLEQISHDGSQKIPARILPVIAHHAVQGRIANLACFVLAAWIAFNKTRRLGDNPPTDGFLTQIQSQLPDPTLSAQEYAEQFLSLTDVIPSNISGNKDVRNGVIRHMTAILASGLPDALSHLRAGG